jgi:opacity protein-like surface antigen
MRSARPATALAVPLLTLAALAFGTVGPAGAQQATSSTGLQEIEAPLGFAGGELLFAFPTGEFAENVSFGFGIGGYARFPFGGEDLLSLRVDLGFLNYGNETIRICVTDPCRVQGDLTTSNNIFFGGVGPELGIVSGPARLYANASVGFAFFATSSSVSGSSDFGQEPFASSTNHQDATFAWMAGPGFQLRVSGGRIPVFLDIGGRYHGNGEARYLRKGDIIDHPDGSVTIDPQQSDTNLWTLRLGVSAGIPPSGFGFGSAR